MSLDRIGLKVSDYDSISSNLELQDGVRIRFKNLGYDVGSGAAPITAWAGFSSDFQLDFAEGMKGVAYAGGTVSVAGGELVCNPGGVAYGDRRNFRGDDTTFLFRYTPNYNGNPPALIALWELAYVRDVTEDIMWIRSDNGTLWIRLQNTSWSNVWQTSWTAEQVNGTGNTWSSTEPIMFAFGIKNGTARLWAGRVSSGQCKLLGEATGLVGFQDWTILGGFYLGNRTGSTNQSAYGSFSELVACEGMLATDTFDIPAELTRVYSTTASEAVWNEIDLGGERTVDMSAFSINENTGGETGTVKYKYSCHNVAGAPTWNGTWLTLAQMQAEADPTGRFFQLKAQFTSDGVQQASVADTGDMLTVGDAAPDAPSGPTLHSVTGLNQVATLTITPSVDHYNRTEIYHRKVVRNEASAWSGPTYWTGTAGVQGTSSVSGLVNGQWYEFVCIDTSSAGLNSEPSISKKAYIENAAGSHWNNHTKPVLDEILRLLETNKNSWPSPMTVKTVYRGGLEWLPKVGLLNQYVPCIFVKPVRTPRIPRTLSGHVREEIQLRLVYIFAVDTSAGNANDRRVDFLHHISDFLERHFGLPELGLDNGQVEYTWIPMLDYEPVEDGFLAETVQAELTAVALNIVASTLNNRT